MRREDRTLPRQGASRGRAQSGRDSIGPIGLGSNNEFAECRRRCSSCRRQIEPHGRRRQMPADARRRAHAYHVVDRLRPAGFRLILNANGDLLALPRSICPVVTDPGRRHAGPLAGVHAGMEWAKTNRPDMICDHRRDRHAVFPTDLVARFLAVGRRRAKAPGRAVGGRTHPVFGLWPVSLALAILNVACRRQRKVQAWVREHQAQESSFRQ